MAKKDRMSGNEAVALALRQINPDVMAAFPITPSTEIPQYFCDFVANGQVDTEFIPVESEHSSMSACIGASAAGARAVTATSSCGLAFMWELLYVAASDRLPIAMAVVNRALTGPININADHSDSMGARDSGWIQIYSENNQEAYDNFVQAYRISEHKDVKLPIMICQDGFITSHAIENIVVLEDDVVKNFVGEYEPGNYLLNEQDPYAVGPYATAPYYFEAKRAQAEAMSHVKDVVLEVAKEYEKISGRSYGLFEEYRMEDAEYAFVIISSAAGTVKELVDRMRDKGIKAGVVKVRLFRPFPGKELAQALAKVKAIAVMDRAESFSDMGGPLGAELRSALYTQRLNIPAMNYIYGLGGRDLLEEHIEQILSELAQLAQSDEPIDGYRFVGARD
ncbi:pyruvate ferredoxin oxidoreductase [Eubacterium oxidoreducens]|uniref:Pyruvate ferredoxin oxidoreductase, alpha subunit n=1 Tax=Eubacterium oxidoreducens TaxID=1732 RepID=A0A1G6CKR2_EUBOX|nr:pyruvate ferredoxin oxidoreductase [Eubacterium oxidoreducens]SDB33471.1 pyruvate ferredoxin oxidoreductase, alpha subunit [Eubacterium oxidoreducens]